MVPTAVAGAVLTGGASTRMGRDKSLLQVDGVAMARRVADALVAAGCRPVFAVGGDAPALAALGLEVIPDSWPADGPLGAIVTALDQSGTATAVVACDLPWLDAVTLDALLTASAGATDADVTVAETDRIEPLCAIWSTSALPHLRASFHGGERAVIRAMQGLRTVTVSASSAALRNVNRPADLPASPQA